MGQIRDIVIVGAGQAGARAAEELRKQGYEGSLRLIGAEPHLPYERPHLSKEYLISGGEGSESVFIHDQAWYHEHRIELMVGTTVEALDLTASSVLLAGGGRIGFDSLLLTTGSLPRRLGLPGKDLHGVHYLRTLDDAQALGAAIADGGRRVVVVGGGWIGLEAAAAARTRGNDVTVIEPAATVLLRVLGPEAGRFFGQLHRSHGVELLLGEGFGNFEETAGRVVAVCTSSNRRVEADLVVVGIGAIPGTALAVASGLHVDNGIHVDSALRSSHPSVFAAGDVANAYHPLFERHLRVEHWDTARMMSRAAARSMLGLPVVYDRIPYFYTDQYEVSMEYSGYVGAEGFDEFLWRQVPDAMHAIGFWLNAGRVQAGMTINLPGVIKQVEALVRSRAPIEADALRDPSQALDTLLPKQ